MHQAKYPLVVLGFLLISCTHQKALAPVIAEDGLSRADAPVAAEAPAPPRAEAELAASSAPEPIMADDLLAAPSEKHRLAAAAAPKAASPARAKRQAVLEGSAYAESDALAGLVAAPASPSPLMLNQDFSTERYDHASETGFRLATEQPLATFSVDVDTASYSNVRRFLNEGRLPPADAVRVEELINYFDYDVPASADGQPLALATELTESPFHAGNQLLRISLRAAAPRSAAVPARNLVFLIDVSGSMDSPNKLPLLQAALRLLVQQLNDRDSVAIVAYAGASGVVLPLTRGGQHGRILAAIDGLGAGGSTNGAGGIQRAYQLAAEHFDPEAVNRVVLATDGDFNVGVTSEGELVRLIESERERGIFLTVLGFGMGNLNDSTMEQLADHGNGSYAYIDTLREARKVLVEQVSSTLRTVAKDTKLQIEWNPARVASYRLIGYENRRLADEAFNDDTKDAGEMGDGHVVTALYELEPSGVAKAAQLDPLKYQTTRALAPSSSHELCTIKVRYKAPADRQSRRFERAVTEQARPLAQAAADTRFATAVAGFGMLLSESKHAGQFGYQDVVRLANGAIGRDPDGYRGEFMTLVSRAQALSRTN